MFAIIVLMFAVCWAPYHIYFILVFHQPSLTRAHYVGHLYLFFYMLAMAHACMNPIIYYWMNKRFRAYFNKILCCFPNFVQRSSIQTLSRASSTLSVFGDRMKFTRSQSCPTSLKTFIPTRCSKDLNVEDTRHIHEKLGQFSLIPFLKL